MDCLYITSNNFSFAVDLVLVELVEGDSEAVLVSVPVSITGPDTTQPDSTPDPAKDVVPSPVAEETVTGPPVPPVPVLTTKGHQA